MDEKVLTFPQKGQRFRRRAKHFFANRKMKDRLFCYIFEKDRKALLQLYNTLNGTDYQDENALRIVTLKNAVYMSMNNDTAFVLAWTLNLYEHQSTNCPNMPLRLLLYVAAEYEMIVDGMDANLYGSTLIRLPAPRCVVFYNGGEDLPEEQQIHLSDAFTDEQGNKKESCLELTVRVLNINYGHNKELMESCKRLKEYAQFVAKIRELHEKGYSMEHSVDMAVTYCIKEGIMKDILQPFRAEVKKMLLTEYDEKKTMRLFRKEGITEGRKAGIAEGRKAGIAEGRKTGIAEGRKAGIAEGRKTGIAEGIEQERNLLIISMFQSGLPTEKISDITKLSIQEIEDIKSTSELPDCR